MPSVGITEEQQSRLEELREVLSREYSGRYASVTDRDLMAYLLDLTDSIEEPSPVRNGDSTNTDPSVTEEAASSAAKTQNDTASNASESASKAEDRSLEAMLKLLETHRGKWRESDGKEPYEVELPDGGVETARTKDDVKAILFQHYR